jgi:hypothetical protein
MTTVYKFRTYEHIEPHYKCNQPGDNSGEYVAIYEYEALQHELTNAQAANAMYSEAMAKVEAENEALRTGFENLQQQLLIEGHTIDCACVQVASVDCSCGYRELK